MQNTYTVRQYGHISEIMAIIGYVIPTFILVTPTFYISYISKTLGIPYYTTFIIIGSPYIGRFIGAYIYSRFRYLGTPFMLSMSVLGLTSFFISILNSVPILIILRFIIGIAFGISTSFAVEVAVRTRKQHIIGLTTGGWAIGWILSAAISAVLPYRYASMSGTVAIPLSVIGVLLRRVNIGHVIASGFNFSVYGFLIYFLAFEPAFVLQIIPQIYGSAAFMESEIAYFLAVPAYMIFPIMAKRYGFRKALYSIASISMILSIFAFLYLNFYAAIVFTVFGLAVNAVIPGFLRDENLSPEKIGPSMNFSAINGFLVPTIIYLIGSIRISAVAITIFSMACLIALSDVGHRMFSHSSTSLPNKA
ncbi:MFS transporter [Thermoplasma sp. Kam2015]|uniref:MFS transporter n=1 Tax=Thermoplasma sp. Kam2015 TaxID=2094122 RepID=UPI000D9DA937|nr:MFS transporter [Thermoplasma sp. Kam2015]PYB67783.1 MFS transporter [Thermoplasma sp. Kam2015]